MQFRPGNITVPHVAQRQRWSAGDNFGGSKEIRSLHFQAIKSHINSRPFLEAIDDSKCEALAGDLATSEHSVYVNIRRRSMAVLVGRIQSVSLVHPLGV
jgi:hypothetical protein